MRQQPQNKGQRFSETGATRSQHPAQPELMLPQDTDNLTGIRARTGVLGWWLNLTAPPWPAQAIPIAERERLRKAELTSVGILAIFAFVVALLSNSLADPATAEAVGLVGVVLVIAAFLNRRGRTRVAAYLVPSVIMLALAASILQGGGIGLIDLPIYDLLAMPIILVAFIGNRNAPWVFAAIAIVFVVGSFLLEPHNVFQLPDGKTFDGIQYELTIFGTWGMVNRHIILLFFAALFGWLGARSVDNAIIRADRAEEIARLEHAFAEQKRQLELGIQQILDTHIKVANGDYRARAPLEQEHILWQIGYSLNNLIARLQRSGEAQQQLQRAQDEVQRLMQAIQRAKLGQAPQWPTPSGTLIDPIITEITGARAGGTTRGRESGPR
jgi:HAMP domain-containing protein